MIIKVYIYDIETGAYIGDDTGHPKYVLNDIMEGTDFTLLRPPDSEGGRLWIDDKWQLTPEQATSPQA